MAKFAPIGPSHLLRRIKDEYGDRVLGDYHLVLAHDVVANKEAWKGLLPKGSTIIIDNSIIELGKPVDIDTMVEAYSTLYADGQYGYKLVVVLPDVFDDPHTTYINSDHYLKQMYSILPQAEYMYVMQSRTLLNCIVAAHYGEQLVGRGVSWVAVPRRMCNNMGTRLYGLLKAMELKARLPQVRIHLMGFSNNIEDDVMCARMPWVEGIDSAVPVRMGQSYRRLDLYAPVGDQAGPRGTFWEDSHSNISPLTLGNIRRFAKAIGYDERMYVPLLNASTR